MASPRKPKTPAVETDATYAPSEHDTSLSSVDSLSSYERSIDPSEVEDLLLDQLEPGHADIDSDGDTIMNGEAGAGPSTSAQRRSFAARGKQRAKPNCAGSPRKKLQLYVEVPRRVPTSPSKGRGGRVVYKARSTEPRLSAAAGTPKNPGVVNALQPRTHVSKVIKRWLRNGPPGNPWKVGARDMSPGFRAGSVLRDSPEPSFSELGTVGNSSYLPPQALPHTARLPSQLVPYVRQSESGQATLGLRPSYPSSVKAPWNYIASVFQAVPHPTFAVFFPKVWDNIQKVKDLAKSVGLATHHFIRETEPMDGDAHRILLFKDAKTRNLLVEKISAAPEDFSNIFWRCEMLPWADHPSWIEVALDRAKSAASRNIDVAFPAQWMEAPEIAVSMLAWCPLSMFVDLDE